MWPLPGSKSASYVVMQSLGVRYQVSGVRIRGVRKRNMEAEPLYETTPKWHGLLMIRLAASMAWIKQRTAEYRITNVECRRMESLAQRRRLRRVSLNLILNR